MSEVRSVEDIGCWFKCRASITERGWLALTMDRHEYDGYLAAATVLFALNTHFARAIAVFPAHDTPVTTFARIIPVDSGCGSTGTLTHPAYADRRHDMPSTVHQ